MKKVVIASAIVSVVWAVAAAPPAIAAVCFDGLTWYHSEDPNRLIINAEGHLEWLNPKAPDQVTVQLPEMDLGDVGDVAEFVYMYKAEGVPTGEPSTDPTLLSGTGDLRIGLFDSNGQGHVKSDTTGYRNDIWRGYFGYQVRICPHLPAGIARQHSDAIPGKFMKRTGAFEKDVSPSLIQKAGPYGKSKDISGFGLGLGVSAPLVLRVERADLETLVFSVTLNDVTYRYVDDDASHQPKKIDAMAIYFPNPKAYTSITLAGSCFVSADAAGANRPAKNKLKKYVLLPEPQQIKYLPRAHRLKPEQSIFIDMASSGRLLDIGRIVQESLARVGPRWKLTAAGRSDSQSIGATITVDASQIPQPQGYRLTIGEDQIQIVAHDTAGAFYAAQTLSQICRQRIGAKELACVEIDDWPDFPNRGVLLDISRDKVPRMKTLYELIDVLSEWKINQFQLYTEHTFAYRNHKVVWEKASPMTGDEIMALDAYCRERFVELVPNQSSFAHLERWLKHKEYLHLAEREDRPFSLSPAVPGSIELIAELYDELLPHFSSKQFNVGCDETFDLGSGKSKDICDRIGKHRVYLDFLLKIHKQVQKHGRTMQFWGDIILHSPELIPELPEGVTAMVWGYEANHPFAGQCPKFAASGVPFYVCPGTSTWNSIAGRTENAIENLRNAAKNGLAHGAVGYLNTNWGDNGHWQPLPTYWLGFAYGATVSWAMKPNENIHLPQALSLHAFKDKAGVMGKLVYDLGNAYKEPGVLLGNQSVLFYILHNPEASINSGPYANLTIDNLNKTRAYINRVIQPLYRAEMDRPDAQQIIDEVANAATLLRHACSLAIARLQTPDGKISSIPENTRKQLATDLEHIISQHERLWLLRNREGGLKDSAARMERMLKLYRSN